MWIELIRPGADAFDKLVNRGYGGDDKRCLEWISEVS